MNVQDFLRSAKYSRAEKGSIGKESDWLPFCNMDVRGGHLQMVEKRILGSTYDENSVSIPVEPGPFVVDCRVLSYGGDRRISRMRVRPKSAEVTLGPSAGAIRVDAGGIAITDVDVFAPSVEDHEDKYKKWIEDVLFGKLATTTIGVLHWKPAKTDIPYTSGGFGDGTYKIFQLMLRKHAVGLEVEFIARGTKYPF